MTARVPDHFIYLENLAVIVTVVYISSMSTSLLTFAVEELRSGYQQTTDRTSRCSVVAGEFNNSNLGTVLSKFKNIL